MGGAGCWENWVCSGSRVMLSKSLLQFSSDRWGSVPFLLAVWPQVNQSWSLKSLWCGYRFLGKAKGDLLQEDLCQTQVYCTQSPCPNSSPLLTRTSAGDTQTQFYLSLRGSLGPGAHKVCLSPCKVSGRYAVRF